MGTVRGRPLLAGAFLGVLLLACCAGLVLAPGTPHQPWSDPVTESPAAATLDPAYQRLLEAGLVEITREETGIIVALPYATEENFMGRAVYASSRAFAVPELVDKLVRVQARLQASGYGLKVLDAYRPYSVQLIMWEAYPDPVWVGSPQRGSSHNRGAAVDVTLVDGDGEELEMPTPFDEFSPRAHVDYDGASVAARRHLSLLRAAMLAEGFVDYPAEWWHFSIPGASRYPLLDLPLPAPASGAGR
ncbi:MAG: M15 family metallopeptidase [Bacillota bacterium]